MLDEIGLGYLRLGQPATTLSGEAQRIKIAAHLASLGGERLLYILDEPTTGLHFDDIVKLLTAFKKLVEAGHTPVVIEHNLDVIKTADCVIDLGPGRGEGGGRSSRLARPNRLRRWKPHTGRALRQVLADGRSNVRAAVKVRGCKGARGARVQRVQRARARQRVRILPRDFYATDRHSQSPKNCSAKCSSTHAGR